MHWKDLTKKERKHLSSRDIYTLKEFKRIAEYQKERREALPATEPCWDCRAIARKLNLPV